LTSIYIKKVFERKEANMENKLNLTIGQTELYKWQLIEKRKEYLRRNDFNNIETINRLIEEADARILFLQSKLETNVEHEIPSKRVMSIKK